MASIQNSPHPLAFRVASPEVTEFAAAMDAVVIRTAARALEGMQKEALVYHSPSGSAWRLVSDEGPYLNGTDLAPFPLAFFTAGLAACYHSAIRTQLQQRRIVFRTIELVQENRYSMTGSALKGTMTGGALPVRIEVRADADTDQATLTEAVTAAVNGAPATEFLRTSLTSEFTLTANGRRAPIGRVAALGEAAPPVPAGFDRAMPASPADFAQGIIEKPHSAETVFGVEGGAGTSLAAEQNRTLHVRGVCTLGTNGIQEIKTQLLKPIGSVFRFLADDNSASQGRAPPGLAYLSAGIAFCYLTQLGRYAHIVKKSLEDYRIVQDTRFSRLGTSGKVAPVRTHVFLETVADEEYARTLVDMGEQTCFLHAACRSAVPVEIVVNP